MRLAAQTLEVAGKEWSLQCIRWWDISQIIIKNKIRTFVASLLSWRAFVKQFADSHRAWCMIRAATFSKKRYPATSIRHGVRRRMPRVQVLGRLPEGVLVSWRRISNVGREDVVAWIKANDVHSSTVKAIGELWFIDTNECRANVSVSTLLGHWQQTPN